MNPRRPEIDGVRGLAILLVLWGHSEMRLGLFQSRLNGLGVHLFFVLSGFLITALLVAEEKKIGKINLRLFFARRFLRILPAFYFFMGVVFVLKVSGLLPDTNWRSMAAALLFLSNVFGTSLTLSHLWSLALEEQFYLLWPVSFSLLAGGRRLGWVLAVIGLIVTARTVTILVRPDWLLNGFIYARPYFRFDSILAGCALALANGWLDRNVSFTPGIARDGVLFAAMIAWCLAAVRFSWVPAVYLTVECGLATWFLWRVLHRESTVTKRMLSSPVLVWAGKLSYSIYLWQNLWLFNPLPGSRVVSFLLAGLGTAGSAWFSYRFIETPFLKRKDDFYPKNFLKPKVLG